MWDSGNELVKKFNGLQLAASATTLKTDNGLRTKDRGSSLNRSKSKQSGLDQSTLSFYKQHHSEERPSKFKPKKLSGLGSAKMSTTTSNFYNQDSSKTSKLLVKAK